MIEQDNMRLARSMCEMLTSTQKSDNKEAREFITRVLGEYIERDQGLLVIPKKEKFYRARIYKEDDRYERYRNPPDGPFQGYNAEQSFINLTNMKAGRFSSPELPCLYLSDSIPGSIIETRTHANMLVSVATIKATRDISIIDFNKYINIAHGDNAEVRIDYMMAINNFISEPKYSADEYEKTIQIAKIIQSFKVDGIKHLSTFNCNSYDSSKRKKLYVNIALHEYNNCEVLDSTLYFVKRVKPEYRKITSNGDII